ncbi:uncharacterized protein BX663DRAFT_523919 [Cokeromyces recurvatus]|uniref:uncharacterized protein n=1 Tax=Cokeromyces recurvatus TaxID=90255 RepID=UPI00221F43E5|nr:uncharacterized protein BX663DRAFT_523919 [Cokeromyces recurvatus]KAI7898732.1 hypothetical protein BX663DRAFT_523919 [Cokeromyces recurvatus]
MTNIFQKRSTINKNRSFCPLILYHDNPSTQLSMELNANLHEHRTAIDRHRNKTNEMLNQNAQFWIELSTNLITDISDCLNNKDIKVLPSTSTTSNISSSSSSSSGDSIVTIDHHVRNSRPPLIKNSPSITSNHFSSDRIEEEKFKMISSSRQKRQSRLKSLKPTQTLSDTVTTTTTTTKKRRRGNLPKNVTEFLRKWLIQHKKHPYPAEKEKIDLARHTGLTVNQISNWFINARRRILQPMLESESLTAHIMAHPDLKHPHSLLVNHANTKRYDIYTNEQYYSNSLYDSSLPTMNNKNELHYQQKQQSIYHSNQKMTFLNKSSLMETNHSKISSIH